MMEGNMEGLAKTPLLKSGAFHAASEPMRIIFDLISKNLRRGNHEHHGTYQRNFAETKRGMADNHGGNDTYS
jgi:hypothetical protein